MTDDQTWKPRWAKLGLESAAVLLSILAAFGIDASWERYQATSEERATLQRVLAEFESNRPELETVGASHRSMHEAGVGLLRAAYGRGDLHPDAAMHLRAVLGMSAYFDPATGALNGYLAGAGEELVASPRLRDRIAGYPAKLDELWQQQGMLRELIAEQIQPYVIAESDRLLTLPPALASAPMHALWAEVWSSTASDQQLVELLNDPRTRNLVAARVMLEAESARKHEQLTREFDAVVEGLREAVGAEPS